MTQVSKYGYIHDKATADSTLGVSDAGNGTFYVIFAEPMTEEHAMFDLTISGHVYSITGTPANTRTKFYWTLGTSKDKTQVDFVDKKPVAEATEAWPTITAEATTIQFTASTFSGGTDTYPTQLTQLNGVDGKPIKGVSMSVSTTADDSKELQKEDEVEAPDVTKDLANKGCQFDVQTAKAVHGKKIVVLVTDGEKDSPLAFSGQQGTTFSIEGETAESATKDDDGEWIIKTAGQKGWSSSVDGLYPLGDEGRNMVVKALAEGTPLCYGLYVREPVEGGQKYTPIRKGMAYVINDEIDAPADDNATYSMDFEGTGKPWLMETATPEEIQAMTFVIKDAD